MQFKKYTSIENSYRSKIINEIRKQGFAQEEWCVLLKVHGSNVSVFIDKDEIRWGRKADFIEPDEKFFNVQSVMDRYNERFRKFFDRFEADGITFRGELFGGQYPHPEVKKDNRASKVQKGVFYAPHNDYFIFDIEINGTTIDHDEVIQFGKELEIPYADYLFRGTFKECLEYPNQFPDPLHKLWNLPEIGDNICEGVVIKPVQPLFFDTGERVILKNKNEKFEEKQRVKKEKVPVELPEHVQKFLEIGDNYITEGRLRNVLSHGDIQVKDHKSFGPLLGEFASDTYEDFIKENEDFFYLEKVEQSAVRKSLSKRCALLIKEHFLNIIDGEF